jgi:hypothetical protein
MTENVRSFLFFFFEMVLEMTHRVATKEETFLWYRYTNLMDENAEPIMIYAVFNPNKRKFKMFWSDKSWVFYGINREKSVDWVVLKYFSK